MEYRYGMRLRGFSIGCQPMDGLIDWYDDESGRYWSILTYNRMLTKEECKQYSLEYLG